MRWASAVVDVVFWSGISDGEGTEAARAMGAQPTSFARSQTLQRPMAPYQLSWWLRKNRVSTQVIEFIFALTKEELITLTEPFISDATICIAVSPTFWPSQMPRHIKEAVDHFKSRFPKLKFVAGGPRASSDVKLTPNFDVTFAGDGEDQFLTWCQQQKRGVSFPNGMFDITHLEHRFSENDVILKDEMIPIELGRGCIFRCKFCGHDKLGKAKGTYRRRIELVRNEMKYNYDTFGTSRYVFLDDTVNEDADKVRELAGLPAQLGFQPTWVGYLRADLVWSRPGDAELLEQSGLLSPFVGIETFHVGASTAIGKGWSGKHARDWLPKLYHDLWGGRINLRINFILGLPGEPISSYFDRQRWCKQNDLGQVRYFPLFLNVDQTATVNYTSSIFEREASRYGYSRNPKDPSSWVNGTQSFLLCSEIAARFNRDNAVTNRVAGFMYTPVLNALGDVSADTLASAATIRANAAAESFKQRYIKQFKEHFRDLFS